MKSLIFDCDGVLVDVSESFRAAIIKTTNWYFKELIGLGKISEDLITTEETGFFKNSGGFNNDWYLTYGVILYFVSLLVIHLKNQKEKILALLKGNGDLNSKLSRLKEFGDLCKSNGLGSFKLFSSRFGEWSLKDFVDSLDARGLPSAEEKATKKLIKSLGITRDKASEILEKLCLYRGTIFDFNIIKRFFEEIYSGNEVFEKVYGIKPLFYSGTGLIENEKLILKKEVLDTLIQDLGFLRFGIASGRLRSQTLPVLRKYENLESYFDLDSSIFLEDIMSAEEAFRSKGVDANLEKPDPYSLLKVAERINPPGQIFGYVGDTASDIIAAKRADEQSKYSVVSIGVLCFASDIKTLTKKFLSLDADIILPSPNDLSFLFTNLEMM
ncbi:MAG: HAD family hydrolase [Candidatus Jordarchaeum sp.]|uniref:HAD family hydrolase n=1 Tax=Candidatus Jordarchaeum sp. TaxID=2823881 RepID=UPI00404A331E